MLNAAGSMNEWRRGFDRIKPRTTDRAVVLPRLEVDQKTIFGFARYYNQTVSETKPIQGGRSEAHVPPALVDPQQYGEALTNFVNQFGRGGASHFGVSIFPGHAADLIDQYDAGNCMPVRNRDLKRVSAGAACNWTNDRKAGSFIVLLRCQHDRWTTALFVAKRGI